MSDLILPGAEQGLLVPPEVQVERLAAQCERLGRALKTADDYITSVEADNALLRKRLLASGLNSTSVEHPELNRKQRRVRARIEKKRARRAEVPTA